MHLRTMGDHLFSHLKVFKYYIAYKRYNINIFIYHQSVHPNNWLKYQIELKLNAFNTARSCLIKYLFNIIQKNSIKVWYKLHYKIIIYTVVTQCDILHSSMSYWFLNNHCYLIINNWYYCLFPPICNKLYIDLTLDNNRI
jgi:hypothetical protein